MHVCLKTLSIYTMSPIPTESLMWLRLEETQSQKRRQLCVLEERSAIRHKHTSIVDRRNCLLAHGETNSLLFVSQDHHFIFSHTNCRLLFNWPWCLSSLMVLVQIRCGYDLSSELVMFLVAVAVSTVFLILGGGGYVTHALEVPTLVIFSFLNWIYARNETSTGFGINKHKLSVEKFVVVKKQSLNGG